MTFPMAPLDPETAERLKAQEVEYGTYRAKGPIYVGNARAYNRGDAVPVSNVERWHYDDMDLVVKVGTQAEKDEFPDEFAKDATPTAPSDEDGIEAAVATALADATTKPATTTTTSRRTASK